MRAARGFLAKLRQWLCRRSQSSDGDGVGDGDPPSGADRAGFVEVEWVVSGAGIANAYRWAVDEFGPADGVDQVGSSAIYNIWEELAFQRSRQ